MATIKTILDTRRAKSDGAFNVIFRITHLRKVYTINSGVSVQQLFWNNRRCEIEKSHPNAKQLNIKLSKNYYKIEQAILLLDDDFTIEKLKAILNGNTIDKSQVTFKVFADELIEQMLETNKTGNALVYRTAMNKFIAFSGKDITFNKIDYNLLNKFEHQLTVSGLKINSISNYFRTIRAIYNKAIKQKIIDRSNYPFYDISIKTEKTVIRAITKKEIYTLIQIPLKENIVAYKSLNYFILSFYLRGISFTDLAYLKQSNVINGRVEYKRRKTHKNYSLKLFSPADTIINKLHQNGSSYLLPVLTNNVVEDSLEAKKIIKQWIKTTNKYLKRISNEAGISLSITTYSSRYAFANIAKRLGCSNELIAEALGHEYGNKVTNIYLDTFDTDVLDNMHYQVISF